MTDILDRIQQLIRSSKVRISAHGYDELAEDKISVREVVAGIEAAETVEEYPTFAKGPSVLTLQHDGNGGPIHVVWGIPKGYDGPAVLVTAYRPDPSRWSDDFRRRR